MIQLKFQKEIHTQSVSLHNTLRQLNG